MWEQKKSYKLWRTSEEAVFLRLVARNKKSVNVAFVTCVQFLGSGEQGHSDTFLCSLTKPDETSAKLHLMKPHKKGTYCKWKML